MNESPAIEIAGLVHRYGDRIAIDRLSLDVRRGEIFALLGPNGSGKTTLFRTLSTLIPLQDGDVSILGLDLVRDAGTIRGQLGVVFQAASLDKKLTVRENLRHQGRLYGLAGALLQQRCEAMLGRLGLEDRAGDRVETLSGGLRRRVELAKGMLHEPTLLLMDEPSTGLDPAARSDMWRYLEEVRNNDGVTIVLTTHLLDEAERADRIAIMHEGRLAAVDTPTRLKESLGGDSITIRTADPDQLSKRINEKFPGQSEVVDGTVRLEEPDGQDWVPRLVESFGPDIDTITLGKPTLEDVFIARTGHRFWK